MLNNLKKGWNRPLYASMIFFVILFIFFGTILSFSTGDPRPDDHYFHLKYAHLLRTEGWDRVVENFDWIYLLNDNDGRHRYHVSLFQVSLIPFTYFSDPLIGLRVVDIFYASLAFSLFYYVMRKARVKYPLLYALLLFSFTFFTSRILLGRSFVIVPSLLLLEMWLAIERRHKWLFFVCIFHVLWHYSTYFMPISILGAVEAARYLSYKRIAIKNALAVIAGVVVGMMFFPGFPGTLINSGKTIFNIQSDATVHDGSGDFVSLGGKELLSKGFMDQIVYMEIVLFLFVLCVISTIFIYVMSKKRKLTFEQDVEKKNILWIYALFTFTIAMMWGSISISGRVFDFFVPAIVMLSALIITFLLEKKIVYFSEDFSMFAKWGISIFVCIFVIHTSVLLYASANQFDHSPSGAAATWIERNSNGRDKVFLFNWGSFSPLFFSNAHNVYSMGIEPMGLKGYDEDLYWKYYNIFRNQYYCEENFDCKHLVEKLTENLDPATFERVKKENSRRIITSIKRDFGAQFIFSDFSEFTHLIQASPELIEKEVTITSEISDGRLSNVTVFKLK